MLTIFITALIDTTGRDQQMAIIIFLQPSNGPIRTKLLYDWLRYKFTSQVDYAGPWVFARCANLAFPKMCPSFLKKIIWETGSQTQPNIKQNPSNSFFARYPIETKWYSLQNMTGQAQHVLSTCTIYLLCQHTAKQAGNNLLKWSAKTHWNSLQFTANEPTSWKDITNNWLPFLTSLVDFFCLQP